MKKKYNYTLLIKIFSFSFISFLIWACNDSSGEGKNLFQNEIEELNKEVKSLEERNKLELELGQKLKDTKQANIDELGEIASQLDKLNPNNLDFEEQADEILKKLDELKNQIRQEEDRAIDSIEKSNFSLLGGEVLKKQEDVRQLKINKSLTQLEKDYAQIVAQINSLKEKMIANFDIIKMELTETTQSRQRMNDLIQRAIENITKKSNKEIL